MRSQIEWDDGPHAVYNTEQYHQEMSATAAKPGKVIRNQGDVDAAFAGAAKVISAEYYQPHMAHIAMEPPVALANVADGKVEVWGPVQSPWGTRQDVAEKLGVPIEDVTVHVTLLGGGFGRKSKCDYVLEAALLSQEVGAPVRVQWTREDDIRHSFYHTTSVERVEAALDADGKVTGWLYRSVAPSIISTFAEDTGYQFPIEYGMGFADMPFDIANIRCENGQAMAHTRIGWFRSVSNIPRAFAVQSFAAELANELGRDQKDVPARADRSGADHRSEGGRACRRTCGTTASRTTCTRSTPGACAGSSSWPRRRPAGASSCQRAKGSASPRTAASSPTSPPSSA